MQEKIEIRSRDDQIEDNLKVLIMQITNLSKRLLLLETRLDAFIKCNYAADHCWQKVKKGEIE